MSEKGRAGKGSAFGGWGGRSAVVCLMAAVVAACGGGSGGSGGGSGAGSGGSSSGGAAGAGNGSIAVSMAALTFSPVSIGGSAATQTVTLSNRTASSVAVQSIATSDRYSQYSQTNNCGTMLAAAASCAIAVKFAPTIGGAIDGTLSITTSPASSSPAVSLSGTAVGTYTLQGSVQAGGASLVGSPVTLYDATIAATKPLVVGLAVTDSSGKFSVSYNCPSSATGGTAFSDDFLYALASGGARAMGSSNGAIRLLSVISMCATPPATALVDELTTVAASYAVNGFLSFPNAVDAWINTSTQLEQGLRIAGNTALRLADSTTGLVPAALSSTQSIAAQTLNALANSLAACAGSSGASSTACTALFQAATVSGGTTPADTLTAALDISRNPGLVNSANVYNAGATTTVYSPVLSVAPREWSLALYFTGAGLSLPQGLAIDATGNIWVTNFTGNSVSEFDPYGAPLSPATGYTGGGLSSPYHIAIGPNGVGWVTNRAPLVGTGIGSVTRFQLAGTSGTNPTLGGAINITGGGIDDPEGIAIDSQGTAWIGNFTCARVGDPECSVALSQISANGTVVSPSMGWQYPLASRGEQISDVAVDANGDIWAPEYTSQRLLKYSPSSNTWLAFTGGGLTINAVGVAIDPMGNIWAVSSDTLSEFNSSGQAVRGPIANTFSDLAICIDAGGYVWTMSLGHEFSQSGQLLTPNGFGHQTTSGGVAVDQAGNLWSTGGQSPDPYGVGGYVAEYVGIAVPTSTPLYTTPK